MTTSLLKEPNARACCEFWAPRELEASIEECEFGIRTVGGDPREGGIPEHVREHLRLTRHHLSAEVAWATDNVELRTVGIDIGSSTSHLVFSRLELTLEGSRYRVTKREILNESKILLTPYVDDTRIDVEALESFINDQYRAARIRREDVDTGALILTGVAVRRRNARAIAELFAEEAGKFVAVSAGDEHTCAIAVGGAGAGDEAPVEWIGQPRGQRTRQPDHSVAGVVLEFRARPARRGRSTFCASRSQLEALGLSTTPRRRPSKS